MMRGVVSLNEEFSVAAGVGEPWAAPHVVRSKSKQHIENKRNKVRRFCMIFTPSSCLWSSLVERVGRSRSTNQLHFVPVEYPLFLGGSQKPERNMSISTGWCYCQ